MSTSVEHQAANITPPLMNSAAMKCIGVVLGTGASQVLDLETYFAEFDNGEFLTLVADGAKFYVALAENAAGSINPVATGTGATVCMVIPDGTQLPFRPVAGEVKATGISTQVRYTQLHYRVNTSVSTGFLRMYRSSLQNLQGVERFPAP